MLITNKELEMNENYDFLKSLDRGKLLYPRKRIVYAVMQNFCVIQKLINEHEKEFSRLKNLRQTVTSITLNCLSTEELYSYNDYCEMGHDMKCSYKKIVWSSTNALLNNYCKKLNENIHEQILKKRSEKQKKSENTKKPEVRKLQTLLAK